MIPNAWLQTQAMGALFVKNPWGLDEDEQARSSINFSGSTERVDVEVDIPDDLFDPTKVRAFPQFTVGFKDKNLAFPEDHDPDQFSKTLINGMNVMQFMATSTVLGFKTKTKTSGQCNIASEIFLHNSDASEPSTRNPRTVEYEIMVWVSSPADQNIGKGIKLIETEFFDVYVKTDNRRYMAFIMKDNLPTEDTQVYIQWSKVIRTAMQISQTSEAAHYVDTISANYKIFGIETGIEFWAGKGKTFFSDITIDKVLTTDAVLVSNTKPEQVKPAVTEPLNPALSASSCRTLSALWASLNSIENGINPLSCLTGHYPSPVICDDDGRDEELNLVHLITLLGERATTMDNLIRVLTMERNETVATIKELSPENFK